MNNFKKCIAFVVSLTFLLTYSPVMAASAGAGNTPEGVEKSQTVDRIEDGPNSIAAVVDLLVYRPIGAVATLGGVVLFFCSLPFTIPSKSVNRAAGSLIVTPGNYTFNRPLGAESSPPRDNQAK
ncbi:MAG: hypothetical protein KQH63_16630 [Desulfobulbaceae bacterium]|nr:hypothetical protein [Desulfobulbaceae bacterium]